MVTDDERSRPARPPSPLPARVARAIAVTAGGLVEVVVLRSPEIAGHEWLPALGVGASVVALLASLGARTVRVVRAMVPVTWVPLLLFLPAFGLGLIIAPAALGIGVAAIVPDRVALTRRRVVRALIWATVAAAAGSAVLLLGSGGPASS